MLGLVKELLGPLFRRAGSVVAVALVANGIADDTANLVAQGVAALGFIGLDLVAIRVRRNKWFTRATGYGDDHTY